MRASPGYLGSVQSVLSSRIGIDTRALALLRIGMGVLILVDLFYRSFNLTAFYTDHGALPRSALFELRPYFHDVSLHALSGGLAWQVVLFVLLAFAAMMLVAGYRTKLATLLSFVLLGSLHARNPYILNSGDTLLLFLLFWSLFLPLGARFSLDALRRGEPVRRVADVACAAILLQVVLVYSMNAFFKLQSGHWVSGEAIQYTFNIDRFSTPAGRLMAHMPSLLVLMGYSWLALLAASPLLLVLTGRARVVMVALFASFHLGMLLFMRLGVFPLVSMAALIPFLPTSFWDGATVRLRRPLLAANDWLGRFNRKRDDQSGPTFSKHSPAPLTLRAVTKAGSLTRSAKTPVVSVLLVVLLLWSTFSLGVVAFPEPVHQALEGHERGWAMFANPSRSNVWYVAPGALESGRPVDALHGVETPWSAPAHVDPLFPDIRWRKYLAEFHRIEGGDLPVHFAHYLCHKWNQSTEDLLVEFTIYRVDQPIRLNANNPPGSLTPLITHSCPQS